MVPRRPAYLLADPGVGHPPRRLIEERKLNDIPDDQGREKYGHGEVETSSSCHLGSPHRSRGATPSVKFGRRGRDPRSAPGRDASGSENVGFRYGEALANATSPEE